MTPSHKTTSHARVTALFALAATMVGGQAVAADALNGKTLFQANCARCHFTPQLIGAAKSASAINNAINTNKGGMGSLKGKLTNAELLDIAAYVANPSAAVPSPSPAPAPTPAPAPSPTPAPTPSAGDSLPTASTKITTPKGYGSGTVYYPTTGGPYGLVVVAPGFVEAESAINWWGARLASSGFVVVTMGTKTLMDAPDSRATQMMAALNQVVGLNGSGPFAGKIDPSRMAVMGHSMGGGGTLSAARDNPSLKAAIPLAPWHTTTNFSKITVPTMIIACQKDAIAPVSGHAQKFYDSLPSTTPHGMLEILGGDHFCVTNLTNAANKATDANIATAWLKYYVNGDTSVQSTISATSQGTNVSRYLLSGF